MITKPGAAPPTVPCRIPQHAPLPLLVILTALTPSLCAQAHVARQSEAIPVRYSEGTVHGFLELRTAEGALLAHGDLLQVPGDSEIESRMILRFTDMSLFDETVTFTQHRVFAMKTYHLVQRGPAFEADLDASLSGNGRFQVTNTSHKDGRQRRYHGRLDLPADTYNGLAVVIVKNLRAGDTATVHLVAFTPKPRLIGLALAYEGTDTVMLGEDEKPAAHFALKPQLGALSGFLARLLGKLPPDSHAWIVTDQVPAFVRFEGPMYSGPVWRLNLATPTWPTTSDGNPRPVVTPPGGPATTTGTGVPRPR